METLEESMLSLHTLILYNQGLQYLIPWWNLTVHTVENWVLIHML